MSYQNIQVEEFKEKMKESNTKILDVRASEELSEGGIEGHQMINFLDPDFEDHIAELDRDTTYLVYCRSGNRSANACTLMETMGFNNLYNLSGGIKSWNSAMES